MRIALSVGFLIIASPLAGQRRAPPVGPRLCSSSDSSYFRDTGVADREGWYGKHLRALQEPALCAKPGVEVYRFLWLRTFHNPIAVRIQRLDDHYRLIGKQLSGAGGYEPGKLVRDTTIELSAEQVAQVKDLIDQSGYWSMGADSSFGDDGSQWILEVVSNGRYRVVDRWTPGYDGKRSTYRTLCLRMVALSGLTPDSTWIY